MTDPSKERLSGRPYVAMRNPELRRDNIRIRAVEPQDIEDIRLWRNSQMAVLRQSGQISRDAQVKYFNTHVWPEKNNAKPRQILVAIEKADILIGYGGLVYIDWIARKAEISFLLDSEIERQSDKYSRFFFTFLKLIQVLAFEDLRLNRLFTETFSNRIRHIDTLEAAGMKHEGTLREHVIVGGQKRDSLVHAIISSDR